MFTRFMDMSSGGSTKVNGKDYIYIGLPKEQAVEFFENKFGRNPYNVTCNCCGEDYNIYEYSTLEDATDFERQDYSIAEFSKREDVLIIYAEDCK